MKAYDYLIVGSGLYGAVFAREMTNAGKKCLVIDKRAHSGGNLYNDVIEGINIHTYGPHIFHTNDLAIWEYVNAIVPFNHFRYSPLAANNGVLYNLPFNMNTFYKLWNINTPKEALQKINDQVKKSGITIPKNLEEQAISMVGTDVYETFIKGYTEKQWGRKATELPKFIIKRLPVRLTFDNNYFDDKYQGIPTGGYNKLIDGLLKGIDIRLNCDFFNNRVALTPLAETIVYTGMLDEFYDHQFGHLQYRSLRFETEILYTGNYQGVAVINYPDANLPYTRTIEHKHFEFGTQQNTVITTEYPEEWKPGKEAYYPINDVSNEKVLKKYNELANKEKNVIFGGRLAEYKYYDMHQVIGAALKKTRDIISEKK